jgi:tetratricopeptide (TPR) repeat protein
MAGRDETADIIPSGIVLHAYCIRRAIQQGFRTYDLLRGDEPYKYSFGAKDTAINCVLVQTKTGRNLGERLDIRSVSTVFRQATAFLAASQLTKAEAAYRQILQVNPTHATTLYMLGQLLSTKGDHWEAAKTYEALAAVAPTSVKVWSRLARTYQALDRHSEAAGAFRNALKLKPGFALAQSGLGQSDPELITNLSTLRLRSGLG